MKSTTGRWVVYEKRGVEFVPVSKRFKTKRKAQEERQRLQEGLKSRRKTLGVGFIGSGVA